MIFRPLSLCTFLAAGFAGLHLYQSKHEVALLDRELRGIARQIDEANERSQALHAEWAWLNEPERLRGVAQRHLQHEPMQPAQFLRLNEAERRLPAFAAYDGPKALFAERPATAPEGAAISLALLPRVAAPVQLARLAPPPPPAAPPPVAAPIAAPAVAAAVPLALPAAPPKPEAAPAPQLAARLAEPLRETTPRLAEPKPAPVDLTRIAPPARLAAPRPAPRQAPEVAALPPIAAPSRAAPPAPMVAHAAPAPAPTLRPAITQVAVAPAPRLSEPPVVSLGSALGGGRPLLAPPVPFGSANAATLGGVVR
ncbi:MAG: cell division protein FtsL [Paracraurococcus sp.]